ncbi:MAG: hypothetical protein ACYC64_16375, partial [Armatimonadota bacterium]
ILSISYQIRRLGLRGASAYVTDSCPICKQPVASVPERSGGAEAESEGLATFGGGFGRFATEATGLYQKYK